MEKVILKIIVKIAMNSEISKSLVNEKVCLFR